MQNEMSIKKVSAAKFSQKFCMPLYGSYCFSRVPATIEHLLSGKDTEGLPSSCFTMQDKPYQTVVLFLIDGFGWTFFEKYRDQYPFLSRFFTEGIVSKITSQFPSTTAAHVTTINAAEEVGQTGIYEWFYYEPKVDSLIAPLLFSEAGDKALGTLEKKGIAPADIYPTPTFYQQLKKHKVDSYVVQPENIVHSHYSQTMSKGAHAISYRSFEEGLSLVAEAVNEKGRTQSYFFVYFPDIDSMGHRYGVESKEFEGAVKKCFDSLEEFFFNKLKNSSKKVACLVTADHGMVAIDPKTTMYINKELPDLVPLIRKNSKGKVLAPAGSCRDLFLHVARENQERAVSLLEGRFKGKAECYLTHDLIQKGIFGERPVSERFLQRVGDIVVLPYENEAVWWYEKGRFEQHFYASHGGLTRKEMESLFLFISI